MRKLWINLLAPALLFTATALAAEPEKPSPPPQNGSQKGQVADLRAQLAELKIQEVELLEKFGPDHPGVVSMKKKIAAFEQLLKEAREADEKPKPAAKDKEAPKKSNLEQMLETALKSNPDILVAEAKAREADAEVNRARLAVTQKVVQLYNSLEAARVNAQLVEKQFDRMRTMQKTGAVQQDLVDEAEAKLRLAKAELTKLEAEVPYLLGKQNFKGAGEELAVLQGLKWLGGNDKAALDVALRAAAAEVAADKTGLAKATADMDRWKAELVRSEKNIANGAFDTQTRDEIRSQFQAAQAGRDHAQVILDAAIAKYDIVRAYASPKMDAAAINSAQSGKLRAALDKPITLDLKAATLNAILKMLGKENPELILHNKVLLPNDFKFSDVRFNNVPLGAVLQWLGDEIPDCRIVVREYGLLITDRSDLPPDAVLLHDFWKARGQEDKKK